MKLKPLFLTVVFLLLAVSVSFGSSKQSEETKGKNTVPGGFSGKVEETMDAAGYTYVLVDSGSEKRWAAAPKFEVKVGERVIVMPGSLMRNFSSKSLNRTFEEIYFVSRILKEGEKPGAGSLSKGDMPTSTGKSTAAKSIGMDFSGIQKPEGGKTVAEIYAERKTLAGKDVLIRGKVVKVVSRVMDRNWLHLQDGTGKQGSNDLTITTASIKETASVGDTVLVRGRVVLDKDFGSGYFYDILISDGKITVEP